MNDTIEGRTNAQVVSLSEKRTQGIIDTLDNTSALKDGRLLISLYTLEQSMRFMPRGDTAAEHLTQTTLQSFALIVGVVYIHYNNLAMEDYIEDSILLLDTIKKAAFQ